MNQMDDIVVDTGIHGLCLVSEPDPMRMVWFRD